MAWFVTVVVIGLCGLAFVRFQPISIPGYLPMAGFDMLETAFDSADANDDVLFCAYLAGLGLVGGAFSHFLRMRTDDGVAGWRLAVTGLLAFSFALMVLIGFSRLVPVLIAGVTGLASFTLAGWLTGTFDENSGPK